MSAAVCTTIRLGAVIRNTLRGFVNQRSTASQGLIRGAVDERRSSCRWQPNFCNKMAKDAWSACGERAFWATLASEEPGASPRPWIRRPLPTPPPAALAASFVSIPTDPAMLLPRNDKFDQSTKWNFRAFSCCRMELSDFLLMSLCRPYPTGCVCCTPALRDPKLCVDMHFTRTLSIH